MTDKRIFFIQLTEHWFDEPEQTLIEQSAIDEGLDPNATLMLYVKMILVSLRDDGFIFPHGRDNKITPLQLTGITHFKLSNHSLKEKSDFVEKAIKLFEELNLVTIAKDLACIYMVKAESMVMNKSEASQKRLENKEKNEAMKQQLKSEAKPTLEDLEDLRDSRIIFSKKDANGNVSKEDIDRINKEFEEEKRKYGYSSKEELGILLESF